MHAIRASRSSLRVASRTLAHAPLLSRAFASPPALDEGSGGSGSANTSTSAGAIPPPASPPSPPRPSSSSVWQNLVALLTGCGLVALIGVSPMLKELRRSTRDIQHAVYTAREEAAAEVAELRLRVAVLELKMKEAAAVERAGGEGVLR